MSDAHLSLWLKKLDSATLPGQWAIRWAQGAVAAGAQQVNYTFSGRLAEAHCYGGTSTGARLLAQQFVSGHIPPSAADRHWVTALDGLESFPGQLRLISRHGDSREVVTIEAGQIQGVVEEPLKAGAANLTIELKAEKSGGFWPGGGALWKSELQALLSRLKYCPLPVMIGRKLVSQSSPFKDRWALMNAMVACQGSERFFSIKGDPNQILSPRLLAASGIVPAEHRCSLMVTLGRAAAGKGQARVFWIRDGALTGPLGLVGPPGDLHLDILCPGDRPGLELAQWAERDPSSLFPDQLALSVARRMADGLDSLLADLSAREAPIDALIRGVNGITGLSLPQPTKGRAYNALSGSFHESLKALGQRTSLRLSSQET